MNAQTPQLDADDLQQAVHGRSVLPAGTFNA
jgi:hypothetical protein